MGLRIWQILRTKVKREGAGAKEGEDLRERLQAEHTPYAT
jgi:hypothetical protein